MLAVRIFLSIISSQMEGIGRKWRVLDAPSIALSRISNFLSEVGEIR